MAKSIVTAKINNKSFILEVADTPLKRTSGLMGRKQLDKNEGMLFKFFVTGWYPFWTRKTYIDLDYLWLDKSKKIVEIKKSVKASKNLPLLLTIVVIPKKFAKYVIELKGGTVHLNKIKIEDKVYF